MVPPRAPVSSDEGLRQQADESARDKAIAEAKLEVISAGNGRLEVLIGAFGTLVTVLLGGFAFATYRQAGAAATKAAREEFAPYKIQMDAQLAAATETSGKIAQEHDKIAKLSESATAAVNKLPGSKTEDAVAPIERKELTDAAVAAAATPLGRRTAQDFRILMYKAEQDSDWQAYFELAEGMAYLHGDTPADLAFALFGKAFGQQRLGNYDLATHYYDDYLHRCPSDDVNSRSGALNNWGNALSDQADAKHDVQADALFAQAGEKYAAALAIKPDDFNTHYNWGFTLARQATTKQGVEADALLAKASEKYAAALAIKPNDPDTLNNTGNALLNQAETKKGDAADALLFQAGEKFAAALTSKPDLYTALSSWGVVLMLEARGKPREVSDGLMARAEEKVLQAEALAPGTGAYNLACIRALRGDPPGAADWLRKSKEANANHPDCAHIADDRDLDAVRETAEFRQALVDIGCLPATGDTA